MRRPRIFTERCIQFKVSVAFEQEYFQVKSGNAKKIKMSWWAGSCENAEQNQQLNLQLSHLLTTVKTE